MAERIVIEVNQSVNIKYPHDSDDGKNVTQPVAITPQTGALVKKSIHNISHLPTVRTSTCQLEVPVTRTPKVLEEKSLSVTLQVSESSASNSPVVSEIQVARSSGSNKPVTGSSMNNTSSTKLKCTSKDEMPHALPVMTTKLDQLTPRGPKEDIMDERSTRTPKTRNQNNSKCCCTPKIPHTVILPKSCILQCTSPEAAHNSSKRCDYNGFADQYRVNDNISKIPTDKYGDHQLDDEKQKQCDLRGGAYKDLDVESEQDNLPCALVTEKGKEFPERSTISHIGKTFIRLDSVITSTDTSRHDFLEECQKVVERVKKRRSTLSRRRSIQRFGGRKSFGSVLPMLSLTDQISNIDANLPHSTKVSHLIDISIREAMRRLEEECKTDECFEDVRLDLITNSERIGSCTSYKVAELPLVVDECKSSKKIDSTAQSIDEVAVIKNKTKKLEEEYKCWKSLLKKRKHACLSAKRKFCEARSGEAKIKDDCKNKLTCEQQSILGTRPDYSQYMKEVKMAQEKVFFIMQEVNHTANLFSNFLTASKAVGDSCYFAIEEMAFGTVKTQPLKCSLGTLMKLGNSPLS